MRNYIIIFFILLDLVIIINSKKLKTLKNFRIFLNLLAFVEFSFIFWVFYSDNELVILNFIDSIKNKFTNLFLNSHKIIPSELKP
ncbi:MAG: hypothetical protein ACRC3I_11845 [Cetobacterium sp.]